MPADSLIFNSPLSEQRAEALIEALGGGTILDLGCGAGELLLRALERWPGARGTGVDLDEGLLARARREAAARGLDRRGHFAHDDVAGWTQGAGAAIAIGIAHAWGGAAGMLPALRRLAPLVVVGDGFWAQPPTQAALEGLGGASADELGTLDDLLGLVRGAGFEVRDVQVATQEEWDAFEAAWRATQPDDVAAARRDGYEQGYRGVLGFAYVVGLAGASSAGASSAGLSSS